MKIVLMRALVVIFLIVVFMAFSAPVFAQDDGLAPVPLLDPIPFEEIDLNGTWNFETSQPTVSGGCPAGKAVSGTAVMTQNGNEATLKYVTGARCRPAAVCSFTGALEEESNRLVFSNSVDVDDEGGAVSSAIILIVNSNEFAAGPGTNEYHHPEGFECRWNMEVVFTRELEEDEK